ncbi:hypothetical protein M5K25_019452 [Dendrobium thyrsiflorum]|uniref:Uncharacterized protein n=1 Tax=Dendrobium thyrsiflorum TaxID=117978 RepID=A0ABD0UF72_DENTH
MQRERGGAVRPALANGEGADGRGAGGVGDLPERSSLLLLCAIRRRIGREDGGCVCPALANGEEGILAKKNGEGTGERTASSVAAVRMNPRLLGRSSMGTLILLYFTLSLGKMSGGNTNAR